MMSHDDRQENRHDREEPDRQTPSRSGIPSEFPWEETAGSDQPAPVWEDPPSVRGQHAVHTVSGLGSDRGTQAAAGASAVVHVSAPAHAPGNGMAVAGFVLSLVMWIPVPFLNIVLWVLAVIFILNRPESRQQTRTATSRPGNCRVVHQHRRSRVCDPGHPGVRGSSRLAGMTDQQVPAASALSPKRGMRQSLVARPTKSHPRQSHRRGVAARTRLPMDCKRLR